MEKKDPTQALEGFYRTADATEAPASLHVRPAKAQRSIGPEFLKLATACAFGVAVAVGIATSTYEPGVPTTVGGVTSIREQMARNGLSPDDVFGPDRLRSQGKGDGRWHA